MAVFFSDWVHRRFFSPWFSLWMTQKVQCESIVKSFKKGKFKIQQRMEIEKKEKIVLWKIFFITFDNPIGNRAVMWKPFHDPISPKQRKNSDLEVNDIQVLYIRVHNIRVHNFSYYGLVVQVLVQDTRNTTDYTV